MTSTARASHRLAGVDFQQEHDDDLYIIGAVNVCQQKSLFVYSKNLLFFLGIFLKKIKICLPNLFWPSDDDDDALHHTVHDLVLDARVLALGVLPDGHHVHVVVEGLEAFNGLAGTDICIETELLPVAMG